MGFFPLIWVTWYQPKPSNFTQLPSQPCVFQLNFLPPFGQIVGYQLIGCRLFNQSRAPMDPV